MYNLTIKLVFFVQRPGLDQACMISRKACNRMFNKIVKCLAVLNSLLNLSRKCTNKRIFLNSMITKTKVDTSDAASLKRQ